MLYFERLSSRNEVTAAHAEYTKRMVVTLDPDIQEMMDEVGI